MQQPSGNKLRIAVTSSNVHAYSLAGSYFCEHMVVIPSTSHQNHGEADGNKKALDIGYVYFGGRLEIAKYCGNMARWTRT
jgi:hypothetical protein